MTDKNLLHSGGNFPTDWQLQKLRKNCQERGAREGHYNFQYQEQNRGMISESAQRQREALGDRYVKHLICLPVAQAPPALIELKRQQLKLYRTIKTAKEKRNGIDRTENSASQ